MKPLHKFSKEFFDKYKDKPVKLNPYDPKMLILANRYVDLLSEILKKQNVTVSIIGSVAYEIPTTDVEVAVYVNDGNRNVILQTLKDKFGESSQSEKEFARFEIQNEEYEFDIHVYSGYEAEVSKRMTKFMLDNPRLIDEYAAIKNKYCFSRKEYQHQKDIFLNKVIEEIPEKISQL
jgi:GrpB-like predicted nucleotidyltransferase (UPF0157 family)